MSVHSTNQAKPDQTDSRGIILTMISLVRIVVAEENNILRTMLLSKFSLKSC